MLRIFEIGSKSSLLLFARASHVKKCEAICSWPMMRIFNVPVRIIHVFIKKPVLDYTLSSESSGLSLLLSIYSQEKRF